MKAEILKHALLIIFIFLSSISELVHSILHKSKTGTSPGFELFQGVEETQVRTFVADYYKTASWVSRPVTFRGTWDQSANSTVTVQFKEVGEGTEITLIHEGILDSQNGEGKRMGWNSSLEKLSQFCSK